MVDRVLRGVVPLILALSWVTLAACSTSQTIEAAHSDAAQANPATATTGSTSPPGDTVLPATSPVKISQSAQANPVTGTTIPPGDTVPPTVPSTTSSVPETCQSGSVTVTATRPPPLICLHDGATLTVVFDTSTVGLGVAGQWAVPPVGVTPNGILTISSTAQSGDHLTAVLATDTEGTATVTGYYDNACETGDTTPCTIPPLSSLNLTVVVVNP